MDTQTVNFKRPNKSVAWGFSIQGGKEFGCPLSVLRVTLGSIADQLGVRMGDLLIKINDIPTETMTHQQAILQIQNLQVSLEIRKPKDAQSMNIAVEFPPPPPIDVQFSNNCRISTTIGELPPPPPEFIPVKPNPASFPPPPATVAPTRIAATNESEHKVPNIILDKKKLEIFNEKMNEGVSKPPASSASLANFLQNQSNSNKGRDSKDLLVQQTNAEKGSAICSVCKDHITGSYIEANKKIYCSIHFCCSYCGQSIKGGQFIETKEGTLYCIDDFKNNIAPKCARCHASVVEEQIMALGKCWHAKCFQCDHCKKPIPQGQFHVKEDNGVQAVYCEKDYKEFYEIKCTACSYPIDSDDKYLLVSGKNYHVSCFKR